jgi:hypothetical protein
MSRFQKTFFFSLRRTVLGAAAVAALAAGGAASAQTKTLYIGMNGGTMEKAYTQYVFPAFEKLYGAKVVVVPGTSSDILAKAQANKDRPQMHVIFLDDGIMVRAIGMGLCQKQRPNPSLAEIYPAARFKDDMASGVSLGMTGLAYNAKMFKEKGWAAPTSWMDLADPKYKGKVVFQSMSSSSFGLHGFLMFNRIQGGNDKNVEPGFKAWPTTGLLRHHQRRRIGVAAGDGGHGARHRPRAGPARRARAAIRVEHRHRVAVGAHLGGAHRMEDGGGDVAGQARQVFVALVLRARASIPRACISPAPAARRCGASRAANRPPPCGLRRCSGSWARWPAHPRSAGCGCAPCRGWWG